MPQHISGGIVPIRYRCSGQSSVSQSNNTASRGPLPYRQRHCFRMSFTNGHLRPKLIPEEWTNNLDILSSDMISAMFFVGFLRWWNTLLTEFQDCCFRCWSHGQTSLGSMLRVTMRPSPFKHRFWPTGIGGRLHCLGWQPTILLFCFSMYLFSFCFHFSLSPFEEF